MNAARLPGATSESPVSASGEGVPTAPPANQDEEHSRIPMAEKVRRRPAWFTLAQVLGWLVMFGAILGLLIGGWWQIQNRTVISLRFADGHGLAIGDPLRHRGIAVGEVIRIGLAPDLDEVQVRLLLFRGHEALAREGSRFWIERPTISAARVRAVETLLEGRHVAVEPGPMSGKWQYDFRGLDHPPLLSDLASIRDGLEVIVESEDRYHMQVGTPVTYRGLQVGQVTNVQLASDAMKVEARVQIAPDFMNLVRSGTEFWVKYPMDFHVGFGGVDLNLGTLETLAAGGIAFATPTSAGDNVRAGHRFALQSQEPSRWREWRPNLAVGQIQLADGGSTPRPVRIVRVTPIKRLGIRRERRDSGWVIPLRGGLILGPALLLEGIPTRSSWKNQVEGTATSDANAADPSALSGKAPVVIPQPEIEPEEPTNSPWLEIAGKKVDPRATQVAAAGETLGPLTILDLGKLEDAGGGETRIEQLRSPQEVEDCLLISPLESEIMPIGAGRLKEDGGRWWVDRQLSIARDWEGSIVVARVDGKIVGQLLIEDGLMYVATLDAELLKRIAKSAPSAMVLGKVLR